MKAIKIFATLLCITLMHSGIKAMNVTVIGSQTVCTGARVWLAAQVTPLSGIEDIKQIVWTCSGNGTFTETGTTTITGSIHPQNTTFSWDELNKQVDWTANNAVGWVTARVVYRAGVSDYNKTATLDYIQIGFPYGGPTAINGAPLAVCNTNTTAFNVTCPNGLSGNATSYTWSATGGGSASGSGSTGTVTPSVSSSSIVVTVKYVGCGTTSPGYSITVPRAVGTPAPTAGWFDVVMDDGIHCFNHAFVDGASYATSYIWTAPSSQTTYSNENTRNVSGNGGASYSISVKAVNDCGTSSVFSTTAATNSCAPQVPLSVDDLKSAEFNDVSIYPNPANALFQIALPNHKSSARITIMDIAGQIVQDFYTNDVKLSIETSKIPAGLYIVNATAEEFSKNQKLEIVK